MGRRTRLFANKNDGSPIIKLAPKGTHQRSLLKYTNGYDEVQPRKEKPLCSTLYMTHEDLKKYNDEADAIKANKSIEETTSTITPKFG